MLRRAREPTAGLVRRRITEAMAQRSATDPTVSADHGESIAAKSAVASTSTATVMRRTRGPHAKKRRWNSVRASVLVNVPAETHRETAHEAEESADDDAEERSPTESAQHDHQIDSGRHDVGDQASTDLPPEAGPVDPRAETIEPPLVHLAVVNRKLESARAGIRQQRDGTRCECDDGDGTRRGRERVDGDRHRRHTEAQGDAANDAAGDIPRRRCAEAMTTPHLAEWRDRCQHREAAGRPRRSNGGHQGDRDGGHDDPGCHVAPSLTRQSRRTGRRRR